MQMQKNRKRTLKMSLFSILSTGLFAAYSSLVRFLTSMSVMAMSVCEILWAAKSGLPTPVKKTVPAALRRVHVRASVLEWYMCLKKKLRWLCWDMNRAVSDIES